jgi:hypothetical protein
MHVSLEQVSGLAHSAFARRDGLSGSDGSGHGGSTSPKVGGAAEAAAAGGVSAGAAKPASEDEGDGSPSRESASLYVPSLLQDLKRVRIIHRPSCDHPLICFPSTYSAIGMP